MDYLKFMEGYKTYAGLFITLGSTVIGVLGIADVISNEELTQFILAIGNLIGLSLAFYGRYKAKLK